MHNAALINNKELDSTAWVEILLKSEPHSLKYQLGTELTTNKHRYLQFEDINKVKSIYSGNQNLEDKNWLAFNLFVNRMRSRLTDEECRYFDDVLRNYEYETISELEINNGTFINGRFKNEDRNPQMSQIYVTAPIEIQGSLLEFIVLIHELEHLIQFIKIVSSGQKMRDSHKFAHFAKMTNDITLLEELGAIRTELEFLKIIPSDVKTEHWEKVCEHPDITGQQRIVLRSVIMDSINKSDGECISLQFKNRYPNLLLPKLKKKVEKDRYKKMPS